MLRELRNDELKQRQRERDVDQLGLSLDVRSGVTSATDGADWAASRGDREGARGAVQQ